LSKRGSGSASKQSMLEDGVPPHLAAPLTGWIQAVLDDLFQQHISQENTFSIVNSHARQIAARARISLSPHEEAMYELAYAAEREGGQALLDTVDATLSMGVSDLRMRELDQLLLDGGSAWNVADDGNGLQRRVEQTAVEALRTASVAMNASPHLNAAWEAAYGRHPDPSRAYSEAIKAVEAASIPTVLPGAQGAKATLGRVIEALDRNRGDWQLAIASAGVPSRITPLLGMLRLLWQGQTDRHGGSSPTVPIAADAAEAAVHLAVTLVQWFESGVVRRAVSP